MYKDKVFLRILFFFIIFKVPCLTFAYEPVAGNINGTVGPYIYQSNFSSSDQYGQSPTLGGVALIANGDVNENGSLEIAMLYAPRIYLRQDQGYTALEKLERMHITMGYKWWLSTTWSTSLAFFSAYAMGDTKTEYTDAPIGVDFKTSAHDITEYGLDLALQKEIYRHENGAVVVEARYSWSATPQHGEKADHYGIIFGYQFLAQKGAPEKNKAKQKTQ